MTVVVELEHDKKVRVFTKGASELIIDDCNLMLDKKQETELDMNKRDGIKESILKAMA
jgi:magnesium-transporting ATPase (P-type)